ncbi:hypothetical protein KP509_35G048800 [Ceratopteris richardii]|uniref:RING-type domain-containing protein n=1 Tax=Ceratopteris richardii TaxID=49495 RepID=A0A8T2QGT0_CERRI|nr:hypothetical protein KP509_35G048800 [Ceratopteris richardii]
MGQIQSTLSVRFDLFGCGRGSTSSDAHQSFADQNLGGTQSLPREMQKGFLYRQRPYGHSCPQNIVPVQGLLQQGSSDETGSMEWSAETFSQLLASSQREGFGLSESPDNVSVNESPDGDLFTYFDRIEIPSSQSLHRHSPELQGGCHTRGTCSICARPLHLRSAWSDQGVLMNNVDLPVVAVLACSHTFHADCLEKWVLEALKHDPPCPKCDTGMNISKEGIADGVKGKKAESVSMKNRLPIIGSQFWRTSYSSSRLSQSRQLNLEKTKVPQEKGFLRKSFSRKPFSWTSRSVKESGTYRRVNSPARVSPENQS